MVYPSGGTTDGRAGDHVLLAPPFIVDAGEIDTIVERLATRSMPRPAASARPRRRKS